MSGFSADWLALREPADHAARSAAVTRLVADALARRTTATCLDLGAGTGSNVRYLAPRFPVGARWRLVDDDADLLDGARVRLGDDLDLRVADLRELDASVFDAVAVVSASALLDLVSERWLEQLVARTRAASADVLFALNYDGRIVWNPADADDAFVRDLVNAHQRTDKGFGPALGPVAGVRVRELLERAGYRVRAASSDWVLNAPEHAQLQRELLDGWAAAACDVAPADCERINAWHSRRLAGLSSGYSDLIVGHVDVGGVLEGSQSPTRQGPVSPRS